MPKNVPFWAKNLLTVKEEECIGTTFKSQL